MNGINLGDISFGNDGRTVLGSDALRELERSFTPTAGAATTNPSECQGTHNDSSCTNSSNCRMSTNWTSCTNTLTCSMTRNPVSCTAPPKER